MTKKKRLRNSKTQRSQADETNRSDSSSIPNAVFTDTHKGSIEVHSDTVPQVATTSDTITNTKTMRTPTRVTGGTMFSEAIGDKEDTGTDALDVLEDLNDLYKVPLSTDGPPLKVNEEFNTKYMSESSGDTSLAERAGFTGGQGFSTMTGQRPAQISNDDVDNIKEGGYDDVAEDHTSLAGISVGGSSSTTSSSRKSGKSGAARRSKKKKNKKEASKLKSPPASKTTPKQDDATVVNDSLPDTNNQDDVDDKTTKTGNPKGIRDTTESTIGSITSPNDRTTSNTKEWQFYAGLASYDTKVTRGQLDQWMDKAKGMERFYGDVSVVTQTHKLKPKYDPYAVDQEPDKSFQPGGYFSRNISFEPGDFSSNEVKSDYRSVPKEEYPELIASIQAFVAEFVDDPTVPISQAYTYGAGFEMNYKNLWSYRSIQAQSVHGWLQDNAFSRYGRDCFYKTPYKIWVKRYAYGSWLTSQMPLLLQQALIQSDHAGLSSPADTDFTRDKLTQWSYQMLDIFTRLYSQAEDGVNIFAIDHDWLHPVKGLPKDASRFKRNDPLQFPTLIPPTGRTHFHGRWIMTQEGNHVRWIDYNPAPVNEIFQTPPNMSMDENHWTGRSFPGLDRPFESVDEVITLITLYRTHAGINYDPNRPHRPMPSDHVQAHEEIEPTKYPMDLQERTPIRYIPTFKQPRFPQARANTLQTPDDRKKSSFFNSSRHWEQYPPELTNNGDTMPSISGLSSIPLKHSKSPGQRSDLTANTHIAQPPKPSFSNTFPTGDSLGLDMGNGREFLKYWQSMTGQPSATPTGHDVSTSHAGGPFSSFAGTPAGAPAQPIPSYSPQVPSPPGRPLPRHPPGGPPSGGSSGSTPPPTPSGGPPSGPPYGGPPPGPAPAPSGSGGGSGGGGGGPPPAPGPAPPPGPAPVSVPGVPSSREKPFTMKPDINLFPTLSDDAKFPSYIRTLIGVMRGTGMAEVAMADYVPPPEKAESYTNRCMWMFTVFDRTLKTTKGRTILDRHRRQSDGRAVLVDLRDHYNRSTAAQLRTQAIMDKLVTTPLTRSWNKPFKDYISWFIRMVNQYNDMIIRPDQRLTPGMIRSMLDRNILNCKPLATIRTQEMFDTAKGKPPLTLDGYVALLDSAAALVDEQVAARPGPRHANIHEFFSELEDDGTTDGESYDHDMIAQLDAFMSQQRTPAASMNRETWQSLDKATHSAWDQISPSDKAKILSYAEERARRRAATSTPLRSANVTQLDEVPEEPQPDVPDDAAEEPPDDDPTPQQANAAKTHPGDMRRFLSNRSKKGSGRPTSAPRSANHVRWTASTVAHSASGERGDTDGVSPSHSVPPSHFSDGAPDELDLWATAPEPVTAHNELDQWGVDNGETDLIDLLDDVNPPPTSPPIHDDPFGLESIWAEDDRKDFW